MPRHTLLSAILALILQAWVVTAYCNVTHRDDKVCWFKINCYAAVTDVELPSHCLEPNTVRTRIKLTLSLALERFDYRLTQISYLNNVTTFKATGHWTHFPLAIYKLLPNLEQLDLSNNKVQEVQVNTFNNLEHLKNLDLSFNDIEKIYHDAFQNVNNLQYLSLSHNQVKVMLERPFKNLNSLVELDLSYNLILEFSDTPFVGLSSLETLRLNNNKILTFNGALKHLHNLKHLYLQGNKLHQFNVSEIPNFGHLQTFDLSNNTLSSVHPQVFQRHWHNTWSNLITKPKQSPVKILLSKNYLMYLDNASFPEKSLRPTREHPVQLSDAIPTEVDLSYNSINKIEIDAFQGIAKLISLDLSSNKLTEFKINTDNLEYLQHLNLRNNQLHILYYDTFANLMTLKSLDISANNINFVPKHAFSHNYELGNLNMSHNMITELNAINADSFQSGGVLDLSHNGLKKLSLSYTEATGLKELILNSNNIQNLSLIKLHYQLELEKLYIRSNIIQVLDNSSLLHLDKLKVLDLSENLISEIGSSTFSQLKSLSTLYLSHNKLTRLVFGALQGLQSLIYLDLSNNKIEYLETKTFYDLKSLRRLDLEHNGMRKLDLSSWRGRLVPVSVSIGGNKLSCAWLTEALKDFSNGWLGARLWAQDNVSWSTAVDGIPCNSELRSEPYKMLEDDRLLLTNQNILKAIKEQNWYLTKTLNNIIFKLKLQSAYSERYSKSGSM